MKVISMALLIAGTTVLGAPAGVDIDFSVLLPKDWRVGQFRTDETAPYSWSHDQTHRGISLQLTGPTKVDFRGTATPESVTIWVMPQEYQGQLLEGAQFVSAQYLGRRGTYKIFAHSVPEAITWKTWRTDIIEKLNIELPNNGVEPTR